MSFHNPCAQDFTSSRLFVQMQEIEIFLINLGKYGVFFFHLIYIKAMNYLVFNLGGKQCAFMSLSAILTAQNIPLIDWSKTTFNNVLLQEDTMHLKALDHGLIVLDPRIELLSIDNLPTVVSISCGKNMFSYEICRSVTSPIHANAATSPVMATCCGTVS